MSILKKPFVILSFAALLVSTNAPLVQALANPQDPSTEAIITIEADGLEANDATSGPAVPGTDNSPSNGIVKNLDSISYNVEVSLNDADDTNLVATIILSSNASWQVLAPECLTVANGFSVTPDSNLQDNDGDGLNETMVCNLGDHTEGTKLSINPVAQAQGNNTDIIAASVMSSSDNNVNTSGISGTQGDGPIETEITAGFGINIVKSVNGLDPLDESDYSPSYVPAYINGVEGKTLDWHIALNYDSGSELVEDDGSGRQSFTITDTWIGTHSTNNGAIEGDNATGDFDDDIELYGNVTGSPSESCGFVSDIPGATVTCTQASPGEPITIQIDDIPVNQAPLATVRMTMWAPYATVFPTSPYSAAQTYDIDNTVTLSAWGGAGSLVTSSSGTTDLGPEVASEDYLINASRPLPGSQFYKSFDGFVTTKTGQLAVSPGQTIETTIGVANKNPFDSSSAVCDTIDTSLFTFAGVDPVGVQLNAINHGSGNVTTAGGVQTNFHEQFNPVYETYNSGAPVLSETRTLFDGLLYGAVVEYSNVDYAATGDDPWTATCEDAVGGWTTDYTTFPGGAADVVRVRLTWNRDYSQHLSDTIAKADETASRVLFSFNLQVRSDAVLGTYLANTAATMQERSPHNGAWLDTIDGPGTGVTNVEDDASNALYSFNTFNADRVYVVDVSMSIKKNNFPAGSTVYSPGEVAIFTVDPQVNGSAIGTHEMTFTDTLPTALTYVSDTCASEYAAVGLTCTSSVAGNVITYTVPNYTIGDDLPDFTLTTLVDEDATVGTYVNNVTIDSDLAALTDDSYCAATFDQVECESAFANNLEDTASVTIVAPSGYRVEKDENQLVVEPQADFENILTYINLGGSDIGEGHIIDILPHNGDGQESTLRHNSDEPANVNTATQAAANNATFVSVTPSSAGETFEYSTDPHANIDHRPCHPSNWPAGDAFGTGNATLDLICEGGLIDPVTDVPTITQEGTGATNWNATPGPTVTAFRASTPAFPAGEATRDLTLTLNSSSSIDGDLFCNNFGANSDIITLDVISNDVCIPVVAGSISNYVWLDLNQDGVEDVGELPLEGVIINLLDASGDPIYYNPATGGIIQSPGVFLEINELGEDVFYFTDPNTGDRVDPYTVTTDADGLYIFDNLPSGDYQVQVDTSTLPANAVQTYDADGAGDDTSAYTLTPTTDPFGNLTDVEDNDEQDFGYYYNFDLALTKELSTEGPYEPGENITYTIMVENQGTVDATNIEIQDTLPVGITPNDANWVDIGNNQVTIIIPSLPAGETTAVTLTATISADATGTLINIAEIAGAADGDGNPVTDIDSTPDTDPNNDTQGQDNTTDGSGGDEDDSDPAGFTVTAPEEPVTPVEPEEPVQEEQEQEEEYTGEIGNTVYFDENRNHDQDDGEPGIKGVEVELTWAGPDGEFGTDDDRTWIEETNTKGEYYFKNLPEGKYQVDVDLGDNQVENYSIYSDTDGGNKTRANGINSITLGQGETNHTADFGFVIEDDENKKLVKTGTNMPLWVLGALVALLAGYFVRRRVIQKA